MSPIVLYFLFITLVVAYLLMRAEGAKFIKVVLIAIMFYVSSAIWFSFETYQGWPTNDRPNDDAVILAVTIFDKTNLEPGAIYVMAIPCVGAVDTCEEYKTDDGIITKLSPYKIFGYVPTAKNTPRLYRFPYTTENRKAFSEARENLSKGGRSTIKGEGKGKGKGKGAAPGDAEDGDGKSGEGQENAHIDDAPQIVNEGPQDLLRKD